MFTLANKLSEQLTQFVKIKPCKTNINTGRRLKAITKLIKHSREGPRLQSTQLSRWLFYTRDFCSISPYRWSMCAWVFACLRDDSPYRIGIVQRLGVDAG